LKSHHQKYVFKLQNHQETHANIINVSVMPEEPQQFLST